MAKDIDSIQIHRLRQERDSGAQDQVIIPGIANDYRVQGQLDGRRLAGQEFGRPGADRVKSYKHEIGAAVREIGDPLTVFDRGTEERLFNWRERFEKISPPVPAEQELVVLTYQLLPGKELSGEGVALDAGLLVRYKDLRRDCARDKIPSELSEAVNVLDANVKHMPYSEQLAAASVYRPSGLMLQYFSDAKEMGRGDIALRAKAEMSMLVDRVRAELDATPKHGPANFFNTLDRTLELWGFNNRIAPDILDALVSHQLDGDMKALLAAEIGRKLGLPVELSSPDVNNPSLEACWKDPKGRRYFYPSREFAFSV